MSKGIGDIFKNLNITQLTSVYYKEKNNITQCINLLKNSKYFCFKYSTIEGYTLCTPPTNKVNYYLPYSQIGKKNIINNDSYNSIFNKLFQNASNACIKCGYSEDKSIISKSFYKIISEIINPLFIFVVFDFLDENAVQVSRNEEVEDLEFNDRIKNNKKVLNMLNEDLYINNNNYKLLGIICTPSKDHYTGIIINLRKTVKNLKNNFDYYYDSLKGFIEKLENYRNKLESEYPYIDLYIKN